MGEARAARDRALRAKVRELEAHRRAIHLQEAAAERLLAVGHVEEAAAAAQRAQNARQRLAEGLEEQAAFQ